MRSVTTLFLHALIAQAYDKYSTVSTQEFLGKLIDRAPQVWPTHRAELDGATLGKPGGPMVRSQPVMPFAPHSSLLSASRPGVSRAPRAVQGAEFATKQSKLTWDQKRAPPGGSTYKEWPKTYNNLLDRGLKTVTTKEAFSMVQKGDAVIVDVRPSWSAWDDIPLGPFSSGTMKTFKSGSAQGAINVPYFRTIQGTSMFDIMKRMNAYMFVVEPTERNPDFKDLAMKRLPKDKQLIITCNRGGELETGLPNDKTTAPMRYTSSLKAAHELYGLGFDKLYILDGGMYEWEAEGLPMEAEGLPMDAKTVNDHASRDALGIPRKDRFVGPA